MCYVDSEAYFGVFQHIKADVYPQKHIYGTWHINTISYMKIHIKIVFCRNYA